VAVAFNNTNTATLTAGASVSTAMSVTAGGSNIVAFACVAWDGNTTATVTAITYGGDAMTSCGAKATNGNSSGFCTQIFYRIAPKTGSNTLAITLSAASEVYANLVSFTGVDQTTPVRPSTYQNTISQNNVNPFTMTISSNTSDLTMSIISDDTGGTSTNQTLDGSNTSGLIEMLHDHATTAASSITDTWSFAGAANIAMCGFSIQAASAGGATPLWGTPRLFMGVGN